MMGEQERGQPGQLDLGVPGEPLKVQRPGGLQPEGHLKQNDLTSCSISKHSRKMRPHPRCSDDGSPQEAWARVEEGRVHHSETSRLQRSEISRQGGNIEMECVPEEKVDILDKVVRRSALMYNGATCV